MAMPGKQWLSSAREASRDENYQYKPYPGVDTKVAASLGHVLPSRA